MNEMWKDPKQLCRACINDLSDDDEKYDMIENPILLELYSRFVEIKTEVHDLLPKSLCLSCRNSLIEFDAFQKMCNDSYNFFITNMQKINLEIEEVPAFIIKSDITKELIEDNISVLSYKDEMFLRNTQEPINNINDLDPDPLNAILDPDSNLVEAIPENSSLIISEDSDNETLANKIEVRETRQNDDAIIDLDIVAKGHTIEVDMCGINKYNKVTSDNEIIEKSKHNRKVRTCRKNKCTPKNTVDNERIDEQLNQASRTDAFVCAKCSRKFYSKVQYDGHLRRHEGKKPFICEECPREYSRLSRLKSHMQNDHAGEKIRFHCTVEGCEKQYQSRQGFENHLNSHFNPEAMKKSERITVICELCGKTLLKSGLREHDMMHKGIFPHACDQCPRKFRFRSKLQQHKLKHLDVKKYSCPVCGMKKTTKKEVTCHMNVHTREKEYPCQFCKSCFLTSANLVHHVRVVHDGIKTFHCTYCDQSFGKSETLKHHMMRHTGERPHKCPYCDRGFIQKAAMKIHARQHEARGEKVVMNRTT